MHSKSRKESDKVYRFMMRCLECGVVKEVRLTFDDRRTGPDIDVNDVMVIDKDDNVKIYDSEFVKGLVDDVWKEGEKKEDDR